MKKLLVPFLMFIVPNFVCAQTKVSFLPLDDKHFKPVETFISGSADKLYYGSIDKYMGFAQAGFYVCTWNGQFHTTYPVYITETFFYGDDNRSAMCLHLDTIYVAGSFSSNNLRDAGVIKWDGSQWTKVGKGLWSDYAIFPEISVKKLVSFGNELLACGNFNQLGSGTCNGFASYSGNDWVSVAVQGKINDLLVSSDTLFAAGGFANIAGISCNNIAYKTQGNWTALPDPGIGEIMQLGKLGIQLIAIGKTGVKAYQNGVWTSLSNAWNYTLGYTGSICEFNQTLYVSGVYNDNSGLAHHLLSWDGNTWNSLINSTQVGPANGKRFYVQNSQNHLYFGGNIKTLFGTQVQNVVELFPKYSLVKGYLYKDNNQNCLKDAGDEVMPNAILSLDEGKYYSSTDINGFYQLALSPKSTHTLRVFPGNNQVVYCGSEMIQITTGEVDTSLERNFAFIDKPLPPGEFVKLDCSRGFKVKHGYNADYILSFSANDKQYPFDIELEFDPGLSGFYTENATLSVQDNRIVWRIESPTEIKFSFNINPNHFNMGDELSFKARAYKANWSMEDILNQEVVSAYDPNDKQCSDSRISTGTRSLEYRINFQNLGNDAAKDVYVVDTINRNMPLQYLKVLDYSHRANYSANFKVRDHAVIWGFEGIELGAKDAVGDALSSGFVSFVSGLENHLNIGDSITNRAAIYFDFQAPVFTNTALTRVVTYAQAGNQLGLQLYLYPNPNRGQFTLSLAPYNILKAEIYDECGRLVASKEGNSSGNLEMASEGLARGIYTVKVYHALGVISKQFVVLN